MAMMASSSAAMPSISKHGGEKKPRVLLQPGRLTEMQREHLLLHIKSTASTKYIAFMAEGTRPCSR